MALASILNVPQATEEFSQFSFAHQDQHLQIINGIFGKTSQTLPLYILDPMMEPGSQDFETWLAYNQAAHNDFNGILGLQGNDLSTVDWSKQDQRESWVKLHFTEHYNAAMVLGIG